MSPFKSQAQLRKFASMVKEGKISQNTFDEWLSETKDVGKLPDHVRKRIIKHKKSKAQIARSARSKRVYMGGNRNKTKRKR